MTCARLRWLPVVLRQPTLTLRADDPSRQHEPHARQGVLRYLDQRESRSAAIDDVDVVLGSEAIEIAARRTISNGIAQHAAGHR